MKVDAQNRRAPVPWETIHQSFHPAGQVPESTLQPSFIKYLGFGDVPVPLHQAPYTFSNVVSRNKPGFFLDNSFHLRPGNERTHLFNLLVAREVALFQCDKAGMQLWRQHFGKLSLVLVAGDTFAQAHAAHDIDRVQHYRGETEISASGIMMYSCASLMTSSTRRDSQKILSGIGDNRRIESVVAVFNAPHGRSRLLPSTTISTGTGSWASAAKDSARPVSRIIFHNIHSKIRHFSNLCT